MQASDAQLTKLVEFFKSGTKLSYKKNEFIVRPGESPNNIFYIEKGLVKAYNISKYGEENLLIIRKDNEIFPLIWALTGQERDIIYQSLTPTVVWRIDREKYIAFSKEHPQVVVPVLNMVTEMYRIHSERIINLAYRTVRERLASFLLTMAGRFGEQSKKGTVINVPLRQQDIASSINASRETTSREIAVLERKGLISTKSSIITILELPSLESILE